MYQFYLAADIDHVVTTNPAEGQGHPKAILGYCAQNSGPLGNKPVHRYFRPDKQDHFVTLNPNGENLKNYGYEGVVCYVP